MTTVLKVKIRDRWYSVEVGDLRARPVQVLVDGELVEVEIERLQMEGAQVGVRERPPPSAAQPAPGRESAPSPIKVFSSPMPGTIVSVSVEPGDQVVTGDVVCVLEAMKMQQRLKAEWSGVVRKVHVEPGQQVLDGDPLIELE